jgi:hypothetical protein
VVTNYLYLNKKAMIIHFLYNHLTKEYGNKWRAITIGNLEVCTMIYDSFKIAKFLNISKTSAKAKFKLPEVIPFLTVHNGKTCVEEKGLEVIKQSLKYNKTSDFDCQDIQNGRL